MLIVIVALSIQDLHSHIFIIRKISHTSEKHTCQEGGRARTDEAPGPGFGAVMWCFSLALWCPQLLGPAWEQGSQPATQSHSPPRRQRCCCFVGFHFFPLDSWCAEQPQASLPDLGAFPWVRALPHSTGRACRLLRIREWCKLRLGAALSSVW